MMRCGTLLSDRSLIPDHNDGAGPRVRLELITLSEAQTPWAFWPGSWGGTRAQDPILGEAGVEANSPAALIAHSAWKDPSGFYAACDPADLPALGTAQIAPMPAPSLPDLEAEPMPGGSVKVKYAIPPSPDAPATRLVIGVEPSGGRLPPATTVIKNPGASGEVVVKGDPNTEPMTVRATTHSRDGGVSETARALVAKAS